MELTMKRMVMVALALALCSCGGRLQTTQSGFQPGLPSPLTLARTTPDLPRMASGVYTGFERTLSVQGFRYLDLPGWSANASAVGNSLVLTGSTSTLNYAFFRVSSSRLGLTDTLAQIEVDYEFTTGDPTAPEGLYIGLPDHDKDHWVWLDGRDLNGQLHDVSALNLHGLDPVAFPGGSYIAVVNHSSGNVKVSRVTLRFNTASANDGDEVLYYESHASGDIFGATSVSQVGLSGSPSLVHATDGVTVVYGIPFVVDYHGAWQLTYARRPIPGKSEVWMSGLDGSSPMVIGSSADALIPGGWDYGTDRGLFCRAVSGSLNLYGFHDVAENGRISRSFDSVGKAVWDMSIDTSVLGYAAVCERVYDDVNGLWAIVRFNGNSPFPIDASPESMTNLLAGESQRDPEMVEIDELDGNPGYYIYFAAQNHNDSSWNLYRTSYGTISAEPVIIDPAHDLRSPTPSRDGRLLAYVRLPIGSADGDTGELVVCDLLHPETGEQVLSNDCVGQISWYDPSP